jgi:hypothetical protein
MREHQWRSVVNSAAAETVVLNLLNRVLASGVGVLMDQSEKKKDIEVHDSINVTTIDPDPVRRIADPGIEQAFVIATGTDNVERSRRNRSADTL